MQVKAPVEADRVDNQSVAFGIGPFQRRLAAFVAPARRYDHRQVHAPAGDLFQLALVDAHDTGFGEHQNAHQSSLEDADATG
jgi:hypothetical protein